METENMHNLIVQVRDQHGINLPIGRAEVRICNTATNHAQAFWTEPDGRVSILLGRGEYSVEVFAFGMQGSRQVTGQQSRGSGTRPVLVNMPDDDGRTYHFGVPVGYSLAMLHGEGEMDAPEATEGGAIVVRMSWRKSLERVQTSLTSTIGSVLHGYQHDASATNDVKRDYQVDFRAARGIARIEAMLLAAPVEGDEAPAGSGGRIRHSIEVPVLASSQSIAGDVNVSMRRTATEPTEDLGLWVVIRKSNEALSFNNYFRFMNHVLCGEPIDPDHHGFETARLAANGRRRFDELRKERFLPFTDSEAYRLLKVATEAFVMVNCGVTLSNFHFDHHDRESIIRRVGPSVHVDHLWHRYLTAMNGTSSVTLPYLALIREKLRDAPLKGSMFSVMEGELPQDCFGILRDKLTHPCLIELIWSYWHEEGMLVQSVNAIARRFQNIRAPRGNDPLANLEIDPLRPLNNLFWGYIQDEQHRLSVVRRNYEYDHEYGLRLEGRAVANPRTADSRSKFIEAFHNLLHICAGFYKQDDDTTVIADGFPVLNALKEVHLILSQGAHNQYGEAPATSRIEMLMQQWMLGRPEFREFLPTRIMVAYPEPWMDRVDAMKKVQGWTDTSVLHFRNLAVFGEQVLLSVRYGAWSTVNDPVHGTNWARFWRPEIQGYIHAYRSVTGADLTAAMVGGSVDATLPSVLLRKRLAAQAAAS
jgi:hypothetical protein